VLLLAALLAALAAVFDIGHAQPAEATARAQPLADVWALEVTPELAHAVGPRLVARARSRGVNTLVLNRQLPRKQKRRVRSLARRFHLLVFQPRRLVCQRETVEACAVVARTPAAAKRLARERYIDIVVLRLRTPTPARGLSRRHELPVGEKTARLLLLPTLTAGPRFARESWRWAISAVAQAQAVSLGVTPSGHAGGRAFRLFLGLLGRERSGLVPRRRAGKIVFDGDFETGNFSQWWGAQCANTSSAPLPGTRGTITVQSEIVARGRYGARIDLPAAPAATACEAVRKRKLGTGHGSPAKSEWYALSVRFPTNLHTNKWGVTFGQLNYQAVWGSPLHFFVYGPNDASREPLHARLVAQGGLCRPVGTPPAQGGPGCRWSNGLGSGRNPMKLIPSNRFTLGVWHDLLVHVVWTTNRAEALYEGWHRARGGRWLQTVSFRPGRPSVQWTAARGAFATDTTMDKFGAYRGANSQPTSIWQDNICVATARAAAESCF
jgi:Polysaccharide lyase